MNCEQADIVLVPFPYTDLSSSKQRPALVLSNTKFNESSDDAICCLITTNPKANEYCTKISNARIKDLCYSNIAKYVNDNTLCEYISIDSRKDSCYMTFVLDNKDYSVCDKISNKQLRQSCESLKQLNELNQQQGGS